MAFNPKYSSIPMVSDNIGMPDLPIVLPIDEKIMQSFHGDMAKVYIKTLRGGVDVPAPYPAPYPTE